MILKILVSILITPLALLCGVLCGIVAIIGVPIAMVTAIFEKGEVDEGL